MKNKPYLQLFLFLIAWIAFLSIASYYPIIFYIALSLLAFACVCFYSKEIKNNWGAVVLWGIIIAIIYGIYGIFERSAYSPLSTVILLFLALILAVWSWLSDLFHNAPSYLWVMVFGGIVLWGIENNINEHFKQIEKRLSDLETHTH